MHNRVPVLMYHAIHSQPSVITISPEIFVKQMELIDLNGYRVISLPSVIEYLRGQNELPANTIVLTFDDGFECLYQNAFPVLKALGFSATIFLVSNHVGGDNNWAGQPHDIPTLPILTWDQISEMSNYGIEFGAHTMSHPRLDQTSLIQIEREITGSKQVIEHHLGREVLSFAYPYGRINRRTKEIVRRRFKVACSTNLGMVTPRSDPFELERIEMFYFRDMRYFERIFSSWINAILGGRRFLRTVRASLEN